VSRKPGAIQVDQILGMIRCRIGDRRTHEPLWRDAIQAGSTHQARHTLAAHVNAMII